VELICRARAASFTSHRTTNYLGRFGLASPSATAKIRVNAKEKSDGMQVVHLGFAAVPPATLFHGTIARNLAKIRTEGLKPMNRRHVHLSPDVEFKYQQVLVSWGIWPGIAIACNFLDVPSPQRFSLRQTCGRDGN